MKRRLQIHIKAGGNHHGLLKFLENVAKMIEVAFFCLYNNIWYRWPLSAFLGIAIGQPMIHLVALSNGTGGLL